MRTPLLLASSMLVLLPGGPALAQGGEDALPIASLTCAAQRYFLAAVSTARLIL